MQFPCRHFQPATGPKAKQAFAQWHIHNFTVHKNNIWRVEPFLGSMPGCCVCYALAGPVTAGQQLCGGLGKYRARQHCSTLQLGRGLQIVACENVFQPRSEGGRWSVRRKAAGLSPRRPASSRAASWLVTGWGRKESGAAFSATWPDRQQWKIIMLGTESQSSFRCCLVAICVLIVQKEKKDGDNFSTFRPFWLHGNRH